MTEITKNIVEALAKMGQEKLEAADSMAAIQSFLKEQGLEVSTEDIKAALEAAASAGKAEVSEEDLENVAGGIGPAALIPLIPTAIGLVKKLLPGKDKPAEKPANPAAPATPAGPTNNQTNTNDHGVQFSSQNGNNNNSGGIRLG